MKRPCLFHAAVLTACILTASLQAADPAPLLANGGFENGDHTWKIANVPDASASVNETAAHSGRFGLTLTNNAARTVARVMSANLPTAPGRVYTLKFQARTHALGTYGGVSLRFLDVHGKNAGDPSLSHAKATGIGGAWQAHTLTATAPEGAATVSVWVHTYSKQKGVVDFDDIELIEGTPAADGIPDPVLATSSTPTAAPAPAPVAITGGKGLPIVIKANALTVRPDGSLPPRWEKFAAYLNDRRLKFSIGVITYSLDTTSQSYFAWAVDTSKENYFAWIKEQHASGLVEFWHHGYNHHQWLQNGSDVFEFKGSGYDHQLEHLKQGQDLAREHLGFVFTTFGAPFNATDSDTVRVLAKDTDIRVWLYGNPADSAGKTILDRDPQVNIEHPIFVPNFEKFAAGYAASSASRRYYVIEGHPAQWNDTQFAEFERIIDFLVAHDARFVTPTELADLLQR